MEQCRLEFDACATGAGLIFTVQVNDNIIYSGELSATPRHFVCDFPEGEQKNLFELTLSKKTQQHTEIDSEGRIIRDALIEIRNVTLDDIPIDSVFLKHCEYWHSFNRQETPKQDQFWGDMGCNGTVRFVLPGPTYMWLLENM